MRKTKRKWRNLSKYFRAFLLIALAFLVVGLGTLGSGQSTGKSYELQYRQTADEKEPSVIYRLTPPKGKTTSNVRLVEVYLNAGTVYSDKASATVRLSRDYSATGSFSGKLDGVIGNYFSAETDEKAVYDATFNWTAPFEIPEAGYKLSSYSYYKITARTCDILVNEIVFVGVEYDGDEPTGNKFVIPATVDEKSMVPYNDEKGETKEAALKKAEATIDRQKMPTLSQSSFFRYGEPEIETLATVAEIRAGGSYVAGNKYFGDTVYNSAGVSILALGTLVFGLSPFGLRFFPMLASFGILVVGYFFVKRLFKSEKAGLVFAALYTLCNLSFGLGHLGTPLAIGVFFLFASLAACYRFYAEGLKNVKSGVALLALSGICGALAICVNGAFVVPVAGIVALFAAGMVRQQKAKRYRLEKAIAEAEEEEITAPDPVGEQPAPVGEGKKKVAETVSEYRYKNTAAPFAFLGSLLLGVLVLSLVLALPASFALVKIYDNPAQPSLSIFTLAWKAFSGGFTRSAGTWDLFATVFAGSGERYAVTGICVNAAAALAGLCAVAFAVYRIVRLYLMKERSRDDRAELRGIAIPLAGVVLSLVTAAFAGGGLAFVFSAYAFAFILAAGGLKKLSETGDGGAKAAKIVTVVALVLLVLCFLLFAVFTFSVPLPASFMTKIFR